MTKHFKLTKHGPWYESADGVVSICDLFVFATSVPGDSTTLPTKIKLSVTDKSPPIWSGWNIVNITGLWAEIHGVRNLRIPVSSLQSRQLFNAFGHTKVWTKIVTI